MGHPSCNLEKEYLVEATGPIPDITIEAFNNGITIEGVYYKAKKAERTSRNSIKIILVEGKNREIRRVFSHFHLHAAKLCRVRIGSVLLGNLAEGASRYLTDIEVEGLGSRGMGIPECGTKSFHDNNRQSFQSRLPAPRSSLPTPRKRRNTW